MEPGHQKESDRKALINAINNNLVDVVATDHAPHTLERKRTCFTASSGGPLVQFSGAMLQLAKKKLYR